MYSWSTLPFIDVCNRFSCFRVNVFARFDQCLKLFQSITKQWSSIISCLKPFYLLPFLTSVSRPKCPLLLTIIPVLTFAKCGVSRISFLACTDVTSRCISASCIFMTVATNATLVQIYIGSVDKELKLKFHFALTHDFTWPEIWDSMADKHAH